MSTLTAATIEAQLTSAYPFTVDKFPLSGPDGLHTPHYGLFRSDTGECIGNAVSQRYTPHDTDDVVALAEAAAGAFDGECVVKATWHNGHAVTVAPSADYRREVYGTDTVWPRLIIQAGYDGRPFSASLGMMRDACRNLQMVRPAGAVTGDSIRHTFCLRERLDDLERVFRRLSGGWDTVAETAQQLEAQRVELAEFIRQVYPMADDASRKTRNTHDRRVEKIVRRIVRERERTGRPDLRATGGTAEVSAWEAFNGVQGYVQHDMPRRGRPDDFTRALVALRDPAVGRAHDLAMATLTA